MLVLNFGSGILTIHANGPYCMNLIGYALLVKGPNAAL